jgi:transposase
MEKNCITPVRIQRNYKGRKKRKRQKPNIVNGFTICPARMKTPIKCYEKIPDEFGDPRLHKDSYGDWYLLVPIKSKPVIKIESKSKIALDPGISTFVTGYSTNGTIHNYVENNVNTLTELQRISYLQSRIDLNDKTLKYKKQMITRCRKKIKNQVQDSIGKL